MFIKIFIFYCDSGVLKGLGHLAYGSELSVLIFKHVIQNHLTSSV